MVSYRRAAACRVSLHACIQHHIHKRGLASTTAHTHTLGRWRNFEAAGWQRTKVRHKENARHDEVCGRDAKQQTEHTR